MSYKSASTQYQKSQERIISHTDRMHARLSLRNEIVTEFTRENFSSLSSLLAAVRAKVPHLSGLARLNVRNMSRGWTLERPLMLYSEPWMA